MVPMVVPNGSALRSRMLRQGSAKRLKYLSRHVQRAGDRGTMVPMVVPNGSALRSRMLR